ncbi:DUF4446 family protein [Caldicellulosiruptoraceae bacterium PP1]
MKDFIKTYSNEIILLLLGLIFLVIVINLYISSKYRSIKRRFVDLTKNQDFKSLEEVINSLTNRVASLEEQNKVLNNNLNILKQNSKLAIQKLGIVRYNAFDNVGSNLSFALTLLDANDNGVVLNEIYTREGSTIFAKPIENGTSKYPLSAEEIQSLDIAKKNFYLSEIRE